ncbi:MAG: oligogalacturonate lyase family protein [Bryobacteraceae bacterium]|jgi:oligogalacturonide lyase
MELEGCVRAACSRRWFLMAAPAACFGQARPPLQNFPSAIKRYSDPSTEFTVVRLTDPAYTSRLGASYGRAVSRRTNFMLYACDISGRFEAYQLDLKNGQIRQLTRSEDLDPASLTLLADDRSFCYVDGRRLMMVQLSNLRSREVYRIPEGFERGQGFSVAEDGQYAALVEKKGSGHGLQLIRMLNGTAQTLAEGEEELGDPIPRPRRASVLYRRDKAVWMVNYDGQQKHQLHLADGETGPARWSPDGRTVQYLNYPANPHQLHNLREMTPDTNEDKQIANTTQYVSFACNADASVFIGASGSKASPHVLLLVRAVKRELTLAEHRASDPTMVAPIFAPNSQRIFFTSDQHGKPAIYTMNIERFVEQTEEQ